MIRKLAAAAAIGAFAIAAPTTVFAHSTSIGYENGGPGVVNIWMGTYDHGGHHLEGSLNLVGVNGNPFASTTVAFTLAAGAGDATWMSIPNYLASMPAGLIDGTTNFYGCNSTGALTSSCTGDSASFGQPTHWQGVSFAGLTPGDYQFTYIPIANPSQEWSILNPNMNGIFTITGVIINPSAVPLPAALPLFGTGLGALGLLGWRRKRKAAAVAA